MPKPCCGKCGREMEQIHTGANVALMRRADNKRPYEVWAADVHQCQDCKVKIIARFADKPYWRHFDEDPIPKVDYAIWER